MSSKNNILKDTATDILQPAENSYEAVKKISDYILSNTKHRPKVGIICGSGLGGLANSLVNSDVLPYETIPNFPVTSLPDHPGRLVIGLLSGIPVLCLQGRIHYYEGHPMWKCGMCVRVMKLMGIEYLIVTNAAGGINSSYKVGDLMIMKDHMNFGCESTLRGTIDPRFGAQYTPMTIAYDKDFREAAKRVAAEIGISDIVHEGVYAIMAGPMYETPAELRALRILGADVVGMSTVPEVITARHCNIRVFGLSLVSNMCVLDEDQGPMTHPDLSAVGASRQKQLSELVSRMVTTMSNSHSSES